ncbi:deadenylation complex subunit pan3 [Anaeramoeba flamelloides]|uniref:Deadenylation complex subunit pan3 n=1 Tax=Anaeramoeba flamelloides TaxID=1746091 RepID=A0ABQ8ZBR8_9EUKA|nr:deadenylation complex subunit pan3 [Anaeramoeba flamelloides]
MINSKKSLKELQEQDLISLGKTILSLICGVQTNDNLNESIKLVLITNYSTKLKDLIKYLLMYENSQETPTIEKMVLMINDDILNHLKKKIIKKMILQLANLKRKSIMDRY